MFLQMSSSSLLRLDTVQSTTSMLPCSHATSKTHEKPWGLGSMGVLGLTSGFPTRQLNLFPAWLMWENKLIWIPAT